MSADALQVYNGLETLTGVADAATAASGWSMPGRLPAGRPAVQRRRLRRVAPRRDRRPCWPRVSGRSSSAAPACTCALRLPSSTSDRPSPQAIRDPPPRAAADGRCAGDARRARDGRPRPPPPSSAPTRSASPARSSSSTPATSRHCALRAAADRSTCATRRCLRRLTMEREALNERIDERVHEMVAAGAARRGRETAVNASATARKAWVRRAAAQTHRRDAAQHPPLRQARAHLEARAAERPPYRRHRSRPRRRRRRDARHDPRTCDSRSGRR